MGLSEKGHKITVISFEKEMQAQSFSRILDETSKIKVIPLAYHKSPPVLSTIYDLVRLRSKVKEVIKSQKIEIVHCRSYLTSLIGLWLKRNYGVKFVFDMRGYWADERVEGGLWNRKNALFRSIYNFFKRKEKEFFDEADSIVALTHNSKNEILGRSEIKLKDSTVSVIPTCADLGLFDPGKIDSKELSEVRNELGINEMDFVLLYLGSLGTWYMLEEMLDFYEVFRKAYGGPSKFLFLTKDSEKLERAISQRDIPREEIICTSATRQEVPRYISMCSAGLFFIKPTFSKKASAATKMAEIWGMGKPVITNAGWGDVEELIDKNNGLIVKDLNDQEYSITAKDLSSTTSFDSAQIRSAAVANFSLEDAVAKYDTIYKALLTT